MTKTFSKKLLSIFMAAIMCVSMFAGSIISAQASTRTITARVTASFSSNDYKLVCTNGKTAKLRVCTFNQAGNRTSGELKYKLVSDDGATYTGTIKGCNGISSTSTNITVPKGNTRYRLYLCRGSKSNKNITNTYYLSINFMANCI